MASRGSKDDLNKSPAQRLPMSRPTRFGTKGQKVCLLTNHFKVSVHSTDVVFHHYHVNLKYEDNHTVKKKGVIGRKVIDKLWEIYASDLANMSFAYDGENNLFTIGPLQHVRDEFTVVLEDASFFKNHGGDGSPGGSDIKRMKRVMKMKTFKVEFNLAGTVPMSAITKVLSGEQSDNYEDALSVLDIILRQNSAKQGCLLVRQSFFRNYEITKNIGGGVLPCDGFHSSFQPTQSGLSLNVDLSTITIVQPGPVIDFFKLNQNITDINRIDWGKAKRTLKNLRIKTTHTHREYKIVGFSEKSCNEQTFALKQRNGNGSDAMEVTTVYNYFMQHRHIELEDSAHLPCLNVGKPNRPEYLPMELCHLVSLQRYTKALTMQQRTSLIAQSRKDPRKWKEDCCVAMKRSNYNSDDMLKKCGILIDPEFSQVVGRVLKAPNLQAGDGQYLIPRDGKWNFNNKKMYKAMQVERWAVVNFSTQKVRYLVERLISCGDIKGIQIKPPYIIFEERFEIRQPSVMPEKRVDDVLKKLLDKLPGPPSFLLCVLPIKNCDLYGPWKRKCLAELGIVTQCLVPSKLNDQYLTNVLLKINAKLGGLNSVLQIERNHFIPLVSRHPTIIFGMDVSHGPPTSNVPSIAPVVSSLEWPFVSKYRASVCTQSPRQEMIDSLFKPQGKDDNGLIRELLVNFYNTSGKQKPENIIIFRDGVSEGQFNQVLDEELAKIVEACKFLDESWFPKFTVIVAQKNHHTRFFVPKGHDTFNVAPGTVVDSGICHPVNYDFYMCAHYGRIGTTRPTHYHVLHDEIGFSPDDLQELVHSLSYVYQRSTSAISVVAPVYYAHLAAAQVRQFVRFDNMSSDTASSASGGAAPLPELPRLHENVRSSMFFC
ncbi:hypothetical protein EJB05_32321, partial [Eragrostis curvula]